MRAMQLILVIALLAGMMGCKDRSAMQAPDDRIITSPGIEKEASRKTNITAYINVSSGCQAPTVELINSLAHRNADIVNLEIVDFGSPEGLNRWRADGLECMSILFDGGSGPSPVLKFTDRDGKEKVVVFFMPAKLSWTHEDLEDAFQAMRTGDLQILTEEEAQQELSPTSVAITTRVRDLDGVGQLLINDTPVLMVEAGTDEASALERAQTARKAIDQWLEGPVHPSQLRLAPKDASILIMARDIEVLQVTQTDADKQGKPNYQQLAAAWQQAIKAPIAEACRNAESDEPE